MKLNITYILSTTYNVVVPSLRISIGEHLLFIKHFDDPATAYALVDGALVKGLDYFSLDEGNLWLELGELI